MLELTSQPCESGPFRVLPLVTPFVAGDESTGIPDQAIVLSSCGNRKHQNPSGQPGRD